MEHQVSVSDYSIALKSKSEFSHLTQVMFALLPEPAHM